MTCRCNCSCRITNSTLYAKASEDVEKQVAEELNIPDPKSEDEEVENDNGCD
jgi:hypothetical protein